MSILILYMRQARTVPNISYEILPFFQAYFGNEGYMWGLKSMVSTANILVRAECMRQRKEVAIILGIIFSLSLSFLLAFCSE
jgi:hypothetical protein